MCVGDVHINLGLIWKQPTTTKIPYKTQLEPTEVSSKNVHGIIHVIVGDYGSDSLKTMGNSAN